MRRAQLRPSAAARNRLRRLRSYGEQSNIGDVAVLIDFDNVVVGPVPDSQRLSAFLDRVVGLSLDRWPDAERVSIVLYGGWLEDGVLTRRASDLQASIGAARFFPLVHPYHDGVLHGGVELSTRLFAVPEVEWGHTLRTRDGLPRLRFRDGSYPLACVHRSQTCPLRAMRKFSKANDQSCDVSGCPVTNGTAFRALEQKMVDVMIACDVIDRAMHGIRTLVLSSDLDVLPAIAMAARFSSGEVAVLRVARDTADLYDAQLEQLGVHLNTWEGA